MKKFLIWVDNLFTHYNWTDDLADLLWRGQCFHVIVLVSPDIPDFGAILDYAQWLRDQGDWTVSVQQDDSVDIDSLALVQFRGRGLFWWKPKVRTDWFTAQSCLDA